VKTCQVTGDSVIVEAGSGVRSRQLLGLVLGWFRVGPVAGHQRGRSLRLVLV